MIESYEETAMRCSRIFTKGTGGAEGWLSVRQLAAVAAFAALFAALVVWTTVAIPSPIVDFDVERLVPAFVSVTAGRGAPDDGGSP